MKWTKEDADKLHEGEAVFKAAVIAAKSEFEAAQLALREAYRDTYKDGKHDKDLKVKDEEKLLATLKEKQKAVLDAVQAAVVGRKNLLAEIKAGTALRIS